MSSTATLAEFVAETELEDVPDEVLDKSKQCLFNVLGVSIAGANSEVGEHVVRYVSNQYDSTGDATVVGHGTSSLEGSALANGTFPSVHHYDDTFVSVLMHPSASAFPAAFAACEVEGGDGSTLLEGYTLGIEAAFHVGRSLDPAHRDYGWHGTGTIGSFGAVAASASVLELSARELETAFGIVASGSSALRRNIGTDTNQLHTGHAAQIGVRAAVLARNGFTADDAILESDQGYGPLMKPTEPYDPADVVELLGDEWGTMDVGFKPYPSASISHSALEALLGVLSAEELYGSDVEAVDVHLDPSLSDILSSDYPRDGSSAPASIKYCLAVALERGEVDITGFTDEAVADPGIQSQWEKISCDFSSKLGAGFHKKGARITVTTTDGREIDAVERVPPGGPDNPLDEERLSAKFAECASTAEKAASADEFRSVIDRLDEGAFDEFRTLVREIR